MIKRQPPFVKEIPISSDDRGTFVPFLNITDIVGNKNRVTLKRVYYVYNYGKGIIRGFHYHKKEWKFFCAVSGAAKIVAVNPMNPEEKFTFISSDRKPNLVVIPPTYANAWMSLEDNTILVCGSSSTTEESIKDDKRFDPYVWGDIWTVKGR